MRIFVGNLAFTTTEEELAQLFHPYDAIASVHILTDRDTSMLPVIRQPVLAKKGTWANDRELV